MKAPTILLVMFSLASASPTSSNSARPNVVTAKKGPIELSLEVYRTVVGLQEPIWFKLSLQNNGKQTFPSDRLFAETGQAFGQKLAENIRLGTGVYFVL